MMAIHVSLCHFLQRKNDLFKTTIHALKYTFQICLKTSTLHIYLQIESGIYVWYLHTHFPSGTKLLYRQQAVNKCFILF